MTSRTLTYHYLLRWIREEPRVVVVSREQAEAARERGEGYVFARRDQAEAVRARLAARLGVFRAAPLENTCVAA